MISEKKPIRNLIVIRTGTNKEGASETVVAYDT